MSADDLRLTTRDWAVLVAIASIGATLRWAAAQGGLWLDEAWSAVMAQEAGTPAGVFLWINHDNSHHLNTLWLQLVGFGAAPPLARAFAIVTGTLAIFVAGQIGAVRGRVAAWLTALAFAVSPIFVTIGSEARGYAPMVLALLTAILLVQRALLTDDMRSRARALAIACGLGVAAQLTMVYGTCAIAGWIFVARLRRGTPATAARDTLRLFGPAMLVVALFVGFVFGAAQAAGTGFRFGEYVRFDTLQFLHGLVALIGYTIGFPIASLWLLAAAVVVLALAPRDGIARPFYWFAQLAFPLGIAVIQAVNPGFARYYLVCGVALLLLLAELAAAAVAAGGWRRTLAVVATAACTAGSLAENRAFIRSQRGDPSAIVDTLAARAPHGTRLMYDRASASAMLRYTAANRHYRLVPMPVACPAADYILLERKRDERFPRYYRLCGQTFGPIAQRLAHGLSGTHWTLYARAP